MPTPYVKNPSHASDVGRLIRRGDITVVFQPIVAARDGATFAWEALARPRRGFNDTLGLLAAAQRQDLLQPLDSLVHAMAFASAPYLAEPVTLFVNAAPAVVADAAFAHRTARAAALAGLAPSQIVIEITEMASAEREAELADGAAALRDAGFGVAIDDVGAGQSTLARTVRLRPNWLKLDRSLVVDVAVDPYARTMISAIVGFAASHSIAVIAEGVELPTQAQVLADLGVVLMQGYWFGRPSPVAGFRDCRYSQRIGRRCRTAMRDAA